LEGSISKLEQHCMPESEGIRKPIIISRERQRSSGQQSVP